MKAINVLVSSALSTLLLLSTATANAAGIVIVNGDGAGEGFNDTTSVSAVGGNSATTLGAQRLAVFNQAAAILNATFDVQQTVQVNAQFNTLSCTTYSATLGSAGPANYYLPYDSGTGTYQMIADALANQLYATDVETSMVEISAQFNSNLGNTGCLDGYGWYLGFDAPTGTLNSLLSVVLHELMHGMGFLSLLNPDGSSAAIFNGNPIFDPYTKQLYDNSQSAKLTDLSQSQRAAAEINNSNLVWNGSAANTYVGNYSSGVNNNRMQMYAPSSYISGSSVSHFDTALTPNEIMEPNYTEFLNDAGLAKYALADIGWTLLAANQAPVMGSISPQSMNEDATLNVALSATDADGDTLSYSVTSAPADFNATISGTTLTFAPTANYYGSGSVTVQVSDGTATDSTTFTLTVNSVNDAPVITAVGNQTVAEDNSLSLTLAATDVDGDSLTFSIASAPVELGASVSGTTLTLAPIADYHGSGSITVQVSDGALTDSTSFTLTVTSVNDAPVISSISNQTMNEDATLDVGLSATDADGDGLTFSIVAAAADFGASISGSTLSFSPTANYHGSGTVTVQVSDGALSNSTSFTLTINSINDAPVISAIAAQTMSEGSTLSLTLSATDADGDSLTYSLVSAASDFGASISGSTLSFTPTANYNGSGTVVVQVSDGSLTDSTSFTLTISGVNDAPVISAISDQTIAEDNTLSLTLAATDADGDTLTFSLVSAPAGSGASVSGTTLSFTPTANYHGTGTVTVQVSDGIATDSTSFTLTITSVNDAPVLTAIGDQTMSEDSQLSLTLSATDADGDSLTYSLLSAPADAGAVLVGAVLTFTPTANFSGSGTVSVQVSDGTLTDSASFTLTISAVNDAPVISPVADQTMAEDGTLSITLAATDPDSAVLTYSVISAPAEAGASIIGNTLTFSPQADYYGSGTVTVQVSDGAASDSTSFNLTISSVNDAPVFTAIADQTMDEDSTLSLTLSATDADNDSLTFSLVSAATGFGASLSGATLTFTPEADYNGSGNVTLQVSDGSASDTLSFLLTINAVNDLPVFTATTTYSVAYNDQLTIALTGTDTETAADALTFTLDSFNSSAIDAVLNGKQLTITPVSGFSGQTSVGVSVSDGTAATAATLTINVLSATNQAPVWNSLTVPGLLEEGTATATLSASDADGDDLYFSAVSSGAGLTASVNGSQLTLTAAAGSAGTSSVTLRVSDGLLTTDITVPVTIYPAFNIQSGSSDYGSGSTLTIGASGSSFSLSGGDNSLTTSLFFNGENRDDLLSYNSTSGSYLLAMPDSGAFAGVYTLNVTDSNGLSATYYFERPLLLTSNVSPLLVLAGATQQLTIQGAPASTLISLSSQDLTALSFADPATLAVITQITAGTDATAYNAATVNLVPDSSAADAYSATVTATASNIPDSVTTLDFVLPKTLSINVSDVAGSPISAATISTADARFSLWNLPLSSTTDADGNAQMSMPPDDVKLQIRATNYNDKTVTSAAADSSLNVVMSLQTDAFSLSGIVQATDFSFVDEAPVLTLNFADGSSETLTTTSINSRSVRYAWTGDRTLQQPVSLTVSHSLADTVTINVDSGASSQTINVTLLGTVNGVSTTVVVSSSGGGAPDYLFLVLAFVLVITRGYNRHRFNAGPPRP